ncbi:MAG: hypothetical protein L6Q57_02155 [Alphaproteobacteria bacterium]|nr:hypothetical protein [Alphaproteobacteria bacterium]
MSFKKETLLKNLRRSFREADTHTKAALVTADAIGQEIGDAHIVILERSSCGDLALVLQALPKSEEAPSQFDTDDIVNYADSCFGVDEIKRSQILKKITHLRDKEYISSNIGGTVEDPRSDLIAIVFRKQAFKEEDRLILKTIMGALHHRWERLNWNDRFIQDGQDGPGYNF